MKINVFLIFMYFSHFPVITQPQTNDHVCIACRDSKYIFVFSLFSPLVLIGCVGVSMYLNDLMSCLLNK